MDQRIKVLRGERLNSLIYHNGDGFFYHCNRETFSTIYFQCRKLSQGCPGRALLYVGENILIPTQDHNHDRDPLLEEYVRHRHSILDRARSGEYRSFIEIVNAARRRNLNIGVRNQLNYGRLRSAMQRARASIYPRIPRNFIELCDILEDQQWQNICKTHDQTDSIYCGNATASDGSKVILFISQRLINLLREVSIVFGDGTFFTAPSVAGCYQVIPLAWCLMERKSQPAYIALMVLLRAKLRQWRFNRAVCDYEDAMINAFSTVFAVEVQGCLFHSAHAMAGYAKDLMTLQILQQYPQIKEVVQWCCAIPLLPHNLLQRGLNVIDAEALYLGGFQYNLLRPFFHYIQHEWLDHINRGRTMSVCGSEHRTNNASESNNARMKRELGVGHPNIYHFIQFLVKFEQSSWDDVQSLSIGIAPNRQRSATAVTNDATIRRITNELLQQQQPTDEEVLLFLRRAAHTLHNVINDVMEPQRNYRRA